jgi:hypothetical protein
MASTAKDRAFNRALLSQRRKLASQTQKFDGEAKQYVRVYGWLSHIKDFIGLGHRLSHSYKKRDMGTIKKECRRDLSIGRKVAGWSC